ncbi:low affinity Fe/Cu permease [Chryseobacterium sp. 2987]|nr:low affinity Fe/Cu permease [Chryseobacterium sp. 2987]
MQMYDKIKTDRRSVGLFLTIFLIQNIHIKDAAAFLQDHHN